MLRKCAVATVLIASTMVVVVGDAAADPIQTYTQVDGHSWRYNHTLCAGTCQVQYGNVTSVWQEVQYWDRCDNSGHCAPYQAPKEIDGVFGAHTTANTKFWQGIQGLSKDGIVGFYTWLAAEDRTRFYKSDATYYYDQYLGYRGGSGARFREKFSATYYSNVWDAELYGWHNTSHPGIDMVCGTCTKA